MKGNALFLFAYMHTIINNRKGYKDMLHGGKFRRYPNNVHLLDEVFIYHARLYVYQPGPEQSRSCPMLQLQISHVGKSKYTPCDIST